MALNKQPVLKRCRKLGLDPSYMGVHKKSKKQNQNPNKKMSEYALQLREKQKAKFIYGILEKQFRTYFEKANNTKGVTGENLLRLLEFRLDNVIFRLGLARTRREARQIVSHKLVTVNGKPVNIPSYQVKVGDEVAVREKSKTLPLFALVTDATANRGVPDWLTSEKDGLKGKVNALPNRDQIDVPVLETLIVELYSK
ncbi:30S ribosomal protein S4 [Clostridia bacterium]|nr:30S ribosomal protein S4 [Clostridia bacterium]GHU74610.1 30S ribosomal protein S4 [Clostridia bacterium]